MGQKITSVIKQQPNLKGQLDDTIIYVEPELEDKTIELNENTTYVITAEDKFDGLRSVEITNKVPSDIGLNVFIQNNQPDTPKGIWLQSEKYQYNDVAFVNTLPYIGSLDWKYFTRSDKTYSYVKHTVANDEYLFTFWMGSSNISSRKYNLQTGAMNWIDSLTGDSWSDPVIVGDKIYFFGMYYGNGITNAQCYDITNDEFKAIPAITTIRSGGKTVAIGTDIWVLGGYEYYYRVYHKTIEKYDTITQTATKYDIPFYLTSPAVAAVGTDIYVFGITEYVDGKYNTILECYKYDTLTNSWSLIGEIPENLKGFSVSVGTDIYIIDSKNYKYDTINNTYTLLESMPPKTGKVAFGNNHFYDVRGSSGNVKSPIYKYSLEQLNAATYPADTIIIEQGTTDNYKTELLSIRKPVGDNANISSGFTDVAYYNTNDGGVDTLPTYYGDGTQWVKFKN